MTAPSTPRTSTISPELRKVLDAHRAEVERLRAELGDPAEALSQFVRDHFDQAAFEPEPAQVNPKTGEVTEEDDYLDGW